MERRSDLQRAFLIHLVSAFHFTPACDFHAVADKWILWNPPPFYTWSNSSGFHRNPFVNAAWKVECAVSVFLFTRWRGKCNSKAQHILGPNEAGAKNALINKYFNMNEDPIKEILGGPKCLEQVIVEKTNNNDCVVIATVPRVSETQLTAATGGAELSCYRCTIPFGVVILIAGVVVTAVAYSFNSHGSIISVFGLVLLSSGLLLVCSSALCWKIRQRKKRAKRRESQTALMANQRSLFA